ncbi:PREDICTED: uncharacterized protein LOC106813090 isoform X2 [Priapulus caudatus]|nr:PREDICTED: uncharacterized protein LOC106813090 isoform X2 [Priapulus caudatus]XP_014672630.1 PREDICTED: uncharacterized protein LOC106813090 isoform X2 [Priapulus caudatus]
MDDDFGGMFPPPKVPSAKIKNRGARPASTDAAADGWSDASADEPFRARSQSDSRARPPQLLITSHPPDNVNGSLGSLNSPRNSGGHSPGDSLDRRTVYTRGGKSVANEASFGRPRSGSETKKRGPVMNLVDKFRNRSSSDSRRRHSSSPNAGGDQLLLQRELPRLNVLTLPPDGSGPDQVPWWRRRRSADPVTVPIPYYRQHRNLSLCAEEEAGYENERNAVMNNSLSPRDRPSSPQSIAGGWRFDVSGKLVLGIAEFS